MKPFVTRLYDSHERRFVWAACVNNVMSFHDRWTEALDHALSLIVSEPTA